MKEPIEIKIEQYHFKQSHGYIFDDCPLSIALKERFPTAFVVVGACKAIIIWDKDNDKYAENYQISSDYLPSPVDDMIKIAKQDMHVEMYITLTHLNSQENLFINPINEDHVSKEDSEETSKEVTFSENPFEN